MSVGIEIAFSLEDGRMTKVKATSNTNDVTAEVLTRLYADAAQRTLAVLAIPAPKV